MKTVKLGDVCTIVNGGTPKTSVAEYWDGDILWITPKDCFRGFIGYNEGNESP